MQFLPCVLLVAVTDGPMADRSRPAALNAEKAVTTTLRGAGFCAVAPPPRNVANDSTGRRHSPYMMQTSCLRDDMGSWAMGRFDGNEAGLEAACVQLCRECSRCRFASYSAKASMCAWSSYCDMDDLRQWYHWKASLTHL